MLKDVSNTIQNFMFMSATVLEIAGGPADPRPPTPLVSGVGTKRLGTGRVKKRPKYSQDSKISQLSTLILTAAVSFKISRNLRDFCKLKNVLLLGKKLSTVEKEHVQLRFCPQNRPYFENNGSSWTELGIFVDKHHISHVIELIFG